MFLCGFGEWNDDSVAFAVDNGTSTMTASTAASGEATQDDAGSRPQSIAATGIGPHPTASQNTDAVAALLPPALEVGGTNTANQAEHACVTKNNIPCQKYRTKVQVAIDLSQRLDAQCAAASNTDPGFATLINPALDCLKKSTLNMTRETLVYPIADAHAHFNEIRLAVSQWAQYEGQNYRAGPLYAGPWLENYFISHFENKYDDRIHNISEAAAEATGTSSPSSSSQSTTPFCTYDLFGPYIPILVPWTNHQYVRHHEYVQELWSMLQSLLRPDVPYIVIEHHDGGVLAPGNDLAITDFPNILVMSAGGYGHVPVPLLKQPEDPLIPPPPPGQEKQPTKRKKFPTPHRIPVENRTIVASYVGSHKNAPRRQRQRLVQKLSRINADPNFRAMNSRNLTMFKHFKGFAWQNIMAKSCFSLCPRGTGRTAYHVMEAMQMGLVPVHIYTDIPWLPYIDFLRREKLIIVKRFDEVFLWLRDEVLPCFLAPTPNSTWTFDKIHDMEQRILSFRDSHFSYEGAMKQIEAFIMDPSTSDLKCQALPATPFGDQLDVPPPVSF